MNDINFLCEIGTEEIPAGYIPTAISATEKIFRETLTEKRINFDNVQVLATPRRIAIMISNLADSQREEEIELKGPSSKAAYDASGNPTKALQGFLKGNNITIENVFTRNSDKGDYVFARKRLEAEKTATIIAEIIKNIVSTLPFPKKMKWGDKKITFPRPIAYFLILFNNEIVPFEIEGINSSNKTRGHYIQHNRMIEIKDIQSYQDILKDHCVLIDQKARKEHIRIELQKAAEKAGGELYKDENLLDVVTFLVEDPHIVTCSFNEEFLKVPDIALIAEMKEHQKYFPIVKKDGSLSHKFLVVANNPETDFIRQGNERVVTARFNDARFFYTEDRKKKLEDRVDSLKNVLFHKELGSIYEKIERMLAIGTSIADVLQLDTPTKEKIKRAITLSKTDLETAMVYEFTSLQGQMGKIYALEDGEDPEVAKAIEDHYKPKFQGDTLPESIVSVVASISEKIDNIFGTFSVGNIPKGSQDPYALRRQANAIVEMVIQKEINLPMSAIFKSVSDKYKEGMSLVDMIVDFITARAKTIFSDRGFRYDEIDACLSIGESDYLELFRRAQSIHNFREDAKFSEMLLSFKRMNNIVNAFRKDNKNYVLQFNINLLTENEEKALYEFFESEQNNIKSHIAASKYIELFELLIKGKNIIDSFFDKVLVMDKNIEVRDNRLYILEKILANFTTLLDFSKIADVEK